jgi:lysophospholipase L1-like esterase
VTCTAIDAASRQATCAFRVTLSAPVLSVTKYLAFGDSVTEGQNGRIAFEAALVDVANAYPTRLQALFDASYPRQGIVVLNRGVGGERIEDGKMRLMGVVAQERPGAVLIIDGYNNLLSQCRASIGLTSACSATIDFVAGTLRECVRTARGANTQYVFVGTLTPPGPFRGGTDRRIAASAIAQLNARIRQQIPGEGAVVVDIHPLFLGHESEYVAPDGLHLEAAGNQVVADAFFLAIKGVIPATDPATGSAER